MGEIGIQMVPPCEIFSGYGPPRQHLVARLALREPPRRGQHGADSEEEAFGILPVHHSYHLPAGHTPGTENWVAHVDSWAFELVLSHPALFKCFLFCFISQNQGFPEALEILF